MRSYIKKLRKNFFLWQTKLFGKTLTFFFFSFFFLFDQVNVSLSYSENIFIFHVNLAWLSLIIYTIVLSHHFIYKKIQKPLFFVSIYLNAVATLSGFCWSKSSFGFFTLYDPKILTYFFLSIFLVNLYLFSPKSLFFLTIGFFLLLQERFSIYFLNSMHQSFSVYLFSDMTTMGKTVSLGKTLVVVFSTFFFV